MYNVSCIVCKLYLYTYKLYCFWNKVLLCISVSSNCYLFLKILSNHWQTKCFTYKSLHPKPSFEPIKFNFTYLKLNGLFRKRLSLKEILLRNKEEKRRKKNESSRRSYNKLHKSTKEAKRTRKLRKETKQKIDEKKLKNKLRVKRHREKNLNFS